MKNFLSLLLFSFALFITQHLAANVEDTEKEFEKYRVHYSVFNSEFIPANIASIHNLVRAKDQALINIAVEDKATKKTVKAKISGVAKNLIQQTKTLDFKAIEEPDAYYSLAPIRHTNEEIFHFTIQVLPEGESQALEVKFTRKLYTE